MRAVKKVTAISRKATCGQKRVNYAKGLLEEIGLEKERLEMYNVSASGAKIFVQIARDFTERITKITKNTAEEPTRK